MLNRLNIFGIIKRETFLYNYWPWSVGYGGLFRKCDFLLRIYFPPPLAGERAAGSLP